MADTRTVALVGHTGSGKTSLVEAILHAAGVTDRLGRPEAGNMVTDCEPEEVRRQLSLFTGVAHVAVAGGTVHLLDTPGYLDFVGEVLAALRVADGCLVLVDAAAGVEVGTELTWEYADGRDLPRVVVVNKLDRENASFDRAVASLREHFGNRVVPAVVPQSGADGSFTMIDLLTARAHSYPATGGKPADVPARDLDETARGYRDLLVEAVVETDDDLLTSYLDGEELDPARLRQALATAVAGGRVVPVVPAVAARNVGTLEVTAALGWLPPAQQRPALVARTPDGREVTCPPVADAPLAAQVWKTVADPYVGRLSLLRVWSGSLRSDQTVWNASRNHAERVAQLFALRGKALDAVATAGPGDVVALAKLSSTTTGDTLTAEGHPLVLPPVEFPVPTHTVAILPKAKEDEEKIGSALTRLAEEDPTIRISRQPGTGQMLVSGNGELHLEVLAERLKRKFGVDVVTDRPLIPYRETIRSSVKVQGRHKKQTGGHGQFGDVWLELEPLGNDSAFEFVDKVFGGSVPRQYIPAVEKGVREAMAEGILAGYPVTGVRAILCDGSSHPVDSSELAFKLAGALAFRKGTEQASPVLLEPVLRVTVRVPEADMGEIMGDLNKRRGRILGMDRDGRHQVVRALVPMAEMADYAIALRSMTQGRGHFGTEMDHYEEVPAHVAQAIVSKAKTG